MRAKLDGIQWRRGESEKVPRDLIRLKLPGPCTHADIVAAIAQRFQLQLDPLPKTLHEFTYLSGWPAEGEAMDSADNICNWITSQHDGLHWTIDVDRKILRFEIRRAQTALSPFEELAGRLMHEAPLGPNGRYSRDQYARILEALDSAGIEPRKAFPDSVQKRLKDWNQRHQGKPVKTWTQAYTFKSPNFRRAVQRALSGAKLEYRKVSVQN